MCEGGVPSGCEGGVPSGSSSRSYLRRRSASPSAEPSASIGGIGGALGAWLSGSLWLSLGGSQVFFLATLAALLGAFVAWKGLDEKEC